MPGGLVLPGISFLLNIEKEIPMSAQQATIVVDLGFGDAGKGSIVDYLVRTHRASAVVRFNGGGQAAHNVVTPEGVHHTFAQFGSGTFVRGVRTHLSRFMLVDMDAIWNEAKHLQEIGCGNVFSRLSVDEDARVVTPFHKAGNRLREMFRNNGRHGTCGMGIGETMADSIAHPELTIYASDLRDKNLLVQKLRTVQEVKYAELKEICDSLSPDMKAFGEISVLQNADAPLLIAESLWQTAMSFRIVPGSYLKRLGDESELIFEGAQGVLLDEWHGFHPHTTWSTTTFANAETLLREIDYDGQVEKLGVLRAYFTRHGAGPFPTEDEPLTRMLQDHHNDDRGWQGKFRVGWFDMVLARYALAVSGGADSLAITNLDRFESVSSGLVCTAYQVSQDKMIDRLAPKSVLTDLSYQEALRCLLEKATPLYKSASADNDQYLQMIEDELNVPISIASYGPIAADKRVRARANRIVA